VDEFRPTVGKEHPVQEIVLVPGAKGMYEISVDGKLVYSKKQTGQHISDADAIALMKKVL